MRFEEEATIILDQLKADHSSSPEAERALNTMRRNGERLEQALIDIQCYDPFTEKVPFVDFVMQVSGEALEAIKEEL